VWVAISAWQNSMGTETAIIYTLQKSLFSCSSSWHIGDWYFSFTCYSFKQVLTS